MYYLINFSLALMVAGAVYAAGQPDFTDLPNLEPAVILAAQNVHASS